MCAELRLVNALHRLKDRIAIVGVGNTAYGNFPDIDDYGLGARAFRSAIEDCGLDKDKIDGLLTCRVPYTRAWVKFLGSIRAGQSSYRRTEECPAWQSLKLRRHLMQGFVIMRP